MLTTTAPFVTQNPLTSRILHELGIPVHRIGYNQLCIAIARYSQNPAQILTKEVYPFVSSFYGHSDWHPVEHSIRLAMGSARKRAKEAVDSFRCRWYNACREVPVEMR